VERSITLYRDGHLEWNKGTLSLKSLQENDSAKLKKSLKYDFSCANWGEATDRWLKGVKKRYATLFPDISKQARILAGIKVKGTGSGTESLSSESGPDSSGRDLDSDYEGLVKVSNNNHQNNADGNGIGWNDASGNTEEQTDAGYHQPEGSGHGDNDDGGEQGDGHTGGSHGQQSDIEADNEKDNDDCDEDEERSDNEMLGAEIGVHGELEPQAEASDLTNVSDSD
jgi:hypothetical protein